MNAEPIYSVIGIRSDGLRLIIADQQTGPDAIAMQSRFAQAEGFVEIVIEPGDIDTGHDTVECDFGTIEM